MSRFTKLPTRISNVYLYQHADRAFLIDAGHKVERPTIVAALRLILGREWRTRFAGVFLTHAHPDHDGNATYLRAVTGCEIIGSREEAAYASSADRLDTSKFKIMGGVTRTLFKLMLRVSSMRGVGITTALEDGAIYHGLEVVCLPGHTPGSAAYLHRETGTIFTGDALVNARPPWVWEEMLAAPEAAFCSDYEQALVSQERFRELDFCDLYPGHGPILYGNAKQLVTEFLSHRGPATEPGDGQAG